ncbi:PQQ-dependent sugar dehydrogenase [Microbacterium sp. KR10-403]|uniref:PQQ-dependent sugar dehydrogenase n=1 Tax=Microbacterium sp. KR10-403 TaxID=3158581 RepID=UPI0032E4C503
MGARRGGLLVTVLLVALVGCAPVSENLPATGVPSSSNGDDGTIVRGLDAPWSLAMLPDGGALVSQRDDGRILEISAGDHEVREVGTVPGVVAQGEGGLNGIALWDGDGGTWLYAYHAAADDNRVVRMPLLGQPDAYRLGDAEVVLRGIRKASFHNGGRLAFGPDGMLYVTTGDAGDSAQSQDTSSLGGKILRITPEGEPAPGNPFGNAVYSYGHRNVQGIAWTSDGVMWADEFGQDTWDELNVIVPGGDYGWPVVEGIAHDGRFRDPLLQWHTDQASPSGLAAVGDVLYLACLRGERLWRVTTDGDTVVGDPEALLQGSGRLRDAATADDGTLWVLTNNTDGRGSPRPGDDRVLRFAVT